MNSVDDWVGVMGEMKAVLRVDLENEQYREKECQGIKGYPRKKGSLIDGVHSKAMMIEI